MRLRSVATFALAALAACASPASRIRGRQAEFDSYPPSVQADIRAGRVQVGFTREQAELALGRPDRAYVRKTADATQDVWAYGTSSSRPGLSLGLGVGAGGGGLFGGGSVSTPEEGESRLRLVFQNGAVVSVEKRER